MCRLVDVRSRWTSLFLHRFPQCHLVALGKPSAIHSARSSFASTCMYLLYNSACTFNLYFGVVERKIFSSHLGLVVKKVSCQVARGGEAARVCACGMPNSNKQKAAKAARCGKCKNCLNPKSKRKCLDPKQPQEQQTAAAQFSSPITRRQSDAGRGSRRVR